LLRVGWRLYVAPLGQRLLCGVLHVALDVGRGVALDVRPAHRWCPEGGELSGDFVAD
jgi:hypothetical protein